jgi:AcrR family transcriptional regulator
MMNDQRIRKGELTRKNILKAATLIIGKKGLIEISTSKLAITAGVSKSTIFHHFKSTDELLLSTLDFVFKELLKVMTLEKYQNVEHFLYTLGQSVFKEPESKLTFFKVFLSFSHEAIFNEKYRAVIVSYAEQMNEMFSVQLTQLVPHVNQKSIKSVAGLLLPLMDGIGFHYLLNSSSTKYQEVWELQVKSILQYLDVSK